MKAKHWIVAGLLAFLIAAPCTMAQSVATVTVPYDFFVGSKIGLGADRAEYLMPAGTYECSPGSQVGTLVLRRTDNPATPPLSITVSIQEIPKDLKTIKFVFLRAEGTAMAFDGSHRYVLHKVLINTIGQEYDLTHGPEVLEIVTETGASPYTPAGPGMGAGYGPG